MSWKIYSTQWAEERKVSGLQAMGKRKEEDEQEEDKSFDDSAEL